MREPCQHLGTCVVQRDSPGVRTYRCVCTTSYTGPNCESGTTRVRFALDNSQLRTVTMTTATTTTTTTTTTATTATATPTATTTTTTTITNTFGFCKISLFSRGHSRLCLVTTDLPKENFCGLLVRDFAGQTPFLSPSRQR